MGSCPSKAAGKTESEPDNDDPIKLNTLGETNSTADLGTNATPDGIDKDTSTPETDTKPDPTSVDQDTTDGLLEAVLNASPDVTKDYSTTPDETAVEIPPPPSPPPVDVAVDILPPPAAEPSTLSSSVDIPPPPSPPPIQNVAAPPSPPPIQNVPPPPSPTKIQDNNSKLESADPAHAQIAEPNDAVVKSDTTMQIQPSADPKELNITIHETAAGASPSAPKLSTFGHPVATSSTETSVDAVNSINIPHETVVTVVSPAPKLSTFGTPILAVDTESSPIANNTAEQSKPEDKPVNDVTITSQSPDSKTEDASSLSKQDGKSSSPDVQSDAKTHDDGKEVEIKLILDDVPPPLLLADDTVECNSLESAGDVKKRLFGTEFDPEDDTSNKKESVVRFYVLLIMATVTFTLVSVVIALIVFINFADLKAILDGRTRSPAVTDNVTIEGEIRMRDLSLSSLQPWTKKSLKEHFINLTTEAFINSPYRGLYGQTTITEPLGQGSVIVKFTVQLKPFVRAKSSTNVQYDDMYCSYKVATRNLEQALITMKINGSSGVSVVKLNLYVGGEMVFGVSPTTEKPHQPGSSTTGPMQVPSPSKPSASPPITSTSQSSTTTKSTRETSSTSQKPSSTSASSSTMQSPQGRTSTTTSSSSILTSPTTQTQAIITPTVNTRQTTTSSNVTTQMDQSTNMPTTDMATTEETLTTSTSQSTTPMPTDMVTTEAAPMNQSAITGERRRRETRSLLEITTNRFTKEPSTNPLVQSITSYTHDLSNPVCSPHPLLPCVQAGWSQNTTRTPNRFHLWSETNQLMEVYTTLMQDVDLTSQHGVELQRVICSLLAPSCDDGPMGLNLPCRSACANLINTLKDPIEAGALVALCNTSLPESESGSICFQIHSQNSDTQSACSSGHCLNGGSCFDLNDQAYCRCSNEFGGDRCHIDPCTPNPCTNGGTCLGRAELITSYACGCLAGYHGKHCELSEPVPSTIEVPACLDVLPYGQFISDTKAPGWGIVKPLASCSTDARIMFCAMAHPELYHSTLLYDRRAPCREVCQRVFLECDILFHALDRVFPGICEGLGTNPTEVEHFCTQN